MADKRFWTDFEEKSADLVDNDKMLLSDSEDGSKTKYIDFLNLNNSLSHNELVDIELASNYVGYGHINDQPQTIFGEKTFNDKLTLLADLIVNGTTITANAETVEIKDNILLINNGEVGSGVTAGKAGIEVDRGTATNYLFIFDETTQSFMIGEVSDLQPVATREDAPTNGVVAVWDNVSNKFITNGIPIWTDGTNVAIGKTTASEKLDILGRIKTTSGNEFAFENSQLKAGYETQTDNVSSSSIALRTSLAINYGYTIRANRTTNGKGYLAISFHNNSTTGVDRFILDEAGNVGIGKTPSEKLDVNGNIKVSGNSLKMKGITTAQRDALTPEAGDIIFNTTTNKHEGYDGSNWKKLY